MNDKSKKKIVSVGLLTFHHRVISKFNVKELLISTSFRCNSFINMIYKVDHWWTRHFCVKILIHVTKTFTISTRCYKNRTPIMHLPIVMCIRKFLVHILFSGNSNSLNTTIKPNFLFIFYESLKDLIYDYYYIQIFSPSTHTRTFKSPPKHVLSSQPSVRFSLISVLVSMSLFCLETSRPSVLYWMGDRSSFTRSVRRVDK